MIECDGTAEARAGAVLTIDLDAITENWRRLGAGLKAGCRASAVVKADGYGLGAVAVAGALARAGCSRFFVATLDEGIALRAALPGPDILVMNGAMPAVAGSFHRHRLIPMLNSREQIQGWQALAGARGQALPAALHFDTGMTRLGLDAAEARRLAADQGARAGLELMLVASHLACAEQPEHPLNRQQLQLFSDLRAGFSNVPASLAASSGIFLGPDFHADWVRPGAALYGVNPTPSAANPMRPVLRLQAQILQVRAIDAGITVGYGATHRATAPARLATVAVGYADGFMRALSNRGHGHVGDRQVPLVGRVSMDMTVFDVSGLPEADCRPGAMIDLIGPHRSLDQVAADAGTIGYEILTGLGPRLYRRYLSGAGAAA